MIHSRYEPSEFEFDLAGFAVPVPPEELKSFPAGGTGIGFATPVTTLKFVAERLIKHGKVVRGWMGVTLRKAGPHASITEVVDKGPAARSGLKAGDLLVEVDGKPVTDILAVKRRVEESPVPAKLRARILRAGAHIDLDLIVEAEPKP
jgi:S1-C subfamily serine protease